MRKPKEIDHIDPVWKDNRNYQLVCGFDNLLNYYEREYSLNVRKGNRFLPWRVAKNEIGEEPIEPGDLCQFLNRETGEWVLQEFMGEWWFEQTANDHGGFLGGKTQGKRAVESGQLEKVRNPSRGGRAVFERKTGIGSFTSEQLSLQASGFWWINTLTEKTTKSKTCPGPEWIRGRKLLSH